MKKHIIENNRALKALVITASVMFGYVLFWALVLKLGREDMLVRNHTNLSQLTLTERLMWDLIPFNYRGDDYNIKLQMLTTLLNCFVFAPFGVAFSYLLGKKGGKGVVLGAMLNFGVVFAIESIQLFTMFGNFATEDFITNMAGYFIGVALYYVLFKRFSNKQNVVFFCIINVIVAAIFVYSAISTIGALDVIVELLSKNNYAF